jgi:hypothetical protein
MSAWLVSNAHIDVLINGLAQYAVLPADTDWKTIGQTLWTENNRSVNYRYSERSHHPRYALHTTEAPLDAIAVLKAIGCYDYQSCEHPGWEKSRAHTLVRALEAKILAVHPDLAVEVPSRYELSRKVPAYSVSPEYDRAPWGFEDLMDATTVKMLESL